MRFASLPALLVVVTAVGCSSGPPPDCTDPSKAGCIVPSTQQRDEAPAASSKDVADAVAGNTAFALDLYPQLRTAKGNLCYSPFSISEALAMTYAGARGDTASQMASALHFTLPQDQLHPAFDAIDLALADLGKDGRPFQLSIANALWGQMGSSFQKPFVDTLSKDYGAGMHVVDFAQADASRGIINDWVSSHTNGRINPLLEPGSITSDERLVLTNAVYLNAAWKTTFDASATSDDLFTQIDGTKLTVPTMHQTAVLAVGQGSDYVAVALPYTDPNLTMLIVEPMGAFDAFEASLTPERLTAIEGSLTTAENPVDLALPRFTIQSSFSMAEELAKLGMTDAFTSKADFSGIDGQKDLSIASVVHKAWVDVSEKGTEAAAATSVEISDKSVWVPLETHIDHTFFFFIREAVKSTILFVGRVDDPRS